MEGNFEMEEVVVGEEGKWGVVVGIPGEELAGFSHHNLFLQTCWW